MEEQVEGIVPTAEEEPAFAAFKVELAAELATEPWASFPELTGDIRLLRYLRSREANVYPRLVWAAYCCLISAPPAGE